MFFSKVGERYLLAMVAETSHNSLLFASYCTGIPTTIIGEPPSVCEAIELVMWRPCIAFQGGDNHEFCTPILL